MKKQGLGLVEILIALGILSAVILGITQYQKTMNSSLRNWSSKVEELEIIARVRAILRTKEACEFTLAGSSQTAAVTDIKDRSNNIVFTVGQIYGKRALKLASMQLNGAIPASSAGQIDLTLGLEKQGSTLGGKLLSRTTELQITTDASGNISTCFTDENATIETSKNESCTMIGGTYNSGTGVCDLNQLKIGQNPALVCNATNEGVIRYNGTTKRPEFCNATAWTDLQGPAGPPGANGANGSNGAAGPPGPPGPASSISCNWSGNRYLSQGWDNRKAWTCGAWVTCNSWKVTRVSYIGPGNPGTNCP